MHQHGAMPECPPIQDSKHSSSVSILNMHTCSPSRLAAGWMVTIPYCLHQHKSTFCNL